MISPRYFRSSGGRRHSVSNWIDDLVADHESEPENSKLTIEN